MAPPVSSTKVPWSGSRAHTFFAIVFSSLSLAHVERWPECRAKWNEGIWPRRPNQLTRDHFERPPLRPQRERERERYSIMGLQGRVTDSSTFRYLILSTELGVLFETSRHNNH